MFYINAFPEFRYPNTKEHKSLSILLMFSLFLFPLCRLKNRVFQNIKIDRYKLKDSHEGILPACVPKIQGQIDTTM